MRTADPVSLRPPTLAFALVLATCGIGCSGEKGPSVALPVGTPASSAQRCDPGRPLDPAHDGKLHPPETLRITMRGTDDAGRTVVDGGGRPVFCDHLLTIGDEARHLRFSPGNATRVDVFTESFVPDPSAVGGVHRTASGAMMSVPRDQLADTLKSLTLYPTQSFSCAATQLKTARGFHSATLLTDGRVLVVGGLINHLTQVSGKAEPYFDVTTGVTATGSAEVYDPATQTTVEVKEAAAPTGRAFHHAMLLTSSPCPASNIGVLLVGGLAPSAPGEPIVDQTNGQAGSRLVPFNMMFINSALKATAAANEILCIDPVAQNGVLNATRIALGGERAAFRAADVGSRGLVAASGTDYDYMTLNSALPKKDVSSFAPNGAAPTTSSTLVSRTGATLTLLDEDGKSALLWGGGTLGDPIGELLANLDDKPTALPITAGSTVATQFHTATRTPTGSVLLTGGFQITPGGTNTQPPVALDAVRMWRPGNGIAVVPVSFAGTYTADGSCTAADRYRPAGWESATVLADGRILVTGGTPSSAMAGNVVAATDGSTTTRCQDCLDDASTLCAIPQASIYDPASDRLAPAVDGSGATASLGVPRFGHTSTRLPDGTVVLIGGVGGRVLTNGRVPYILPDIEVYNPRSAKATDGGLDQSDPIYADLAAAGLSRAPNGQATAAGAETPLADCAAF